MYRWCSHGEAATVMPQVCCLALSSAFLAVLGWTCLVQHSSVMTLGILLIAAFLCVILFGDIHATQNINSVNSIITK